MLWTSMQFWNNWMSEHSYILKTERFGIWDASRNPRNPEILKSESLYSVFLQALKMNICKYEIINIWRVVKSRRFENQTLRNSWNYDISEEHPNICEYWISEISKQKRMEMWQYGQLAQMSSICIIWTTGRSESSKNCKYGNTWNQNNEK